MAGICAVLGICSTFALARATENPRGIGADAAQNRQRLSDESVEALRRNLHAGDQHSLRWWRWLRSVDLVDVADHLEVAWVSDLVGIPLLGIEPGTLPTRRQEEQLKRLFGVRSAPARRRLAARRRSPTRVGTAVFPADVGRTVCLREGALPVVNAVSGETLLQLTISGLGTLPANEWQVITTHREAEDHGEMLRSQALMKAEVGRAFQWAHGRGPVPIAVLQHVDDPTNAMLVQATSSMLRVDPHLLWMEGPIDMEAVGLGLDDRVRLLEHVAANYGRVTRGRPFALSEWAGRHLPRQHGLNAGLLDEFGTARSDGYGNIGPGEAHDFGEARIVRSDCEQIAETVSQEGALKYTLHAVGGEELADPFAALAHYDEAVSVGRRHAARNHGRRLEVADRVVAELDENHLRALTGDHGSGVEEVRRRMLASPHVFDATEHDRLLRLPTSELRRLARSRGIETGRRGRARIVRTLLHRNGRN